MKKINKFSKLFPRALRSTVFAAVCSSFVLAGGAHFAAAQQRPDQNPLERIKTSEIVKTQIELEPIAGLGGTCSNVILDGGFETGGIPSTIWDPETSTAFGTPLCNAGCGTGGGSAGPFAGTTWAWFGGTSAAENATLGQTVTIASGSTATLTFQMRIGAVNTPFTDVLNVKVDGTTVQSYPEPTTAEAGYSLRTIDLTAFANGQPHQILFEYIGPGGTNNTANYSVDNVELNVCSAAVGFSVTGRVTTAAGAPIVGAQISMVQGSTTRTAITNGFGYYTFSDVPAGASVITATHKRATFAPLNLNVQGNVTNADIVAQ